MNLLENQKQLFSKIRWRIIPPVMLLYTINGIDKAAFGMAALQMNKELAIASTTFGWLAGIFNVSFFLFGMPNNILTHRFGPRAWIAVMSIVWGLSTILCFFSHGSAELFVLRFMLGAAEGGMVPAGVYYFTYWFPVKERALSNSFFLLGLPAASICGPLISSWLMDHIFWFHHSGWRWMFFLDGIPAIILGIFAYFYLTNKPEQAKWLTQEQKDWLAGELAKEASAKVETAKLPILKIFTIPRVWLLCFIYMGQGAMNQTIVAWLPQLVKEFSRTFTATDVGLVMTLSGIFGAIAMPLWARHSDKTNERIYHFILPLALAGLGLTMVAVSPNLIVKIIGVTFQGIGAVCFISPFWSVPPMFLSAGACAAAVGMINSFSNVGGFIGNPIVGVIKASSWGSRGVLFFQVGCVTFSIVLALYLKFTAKNLGQGSALAATAGNPGQNPK